MNDTNSEPEFGCFCDRELIHDVRDDFLVIDSVFIRVIRVIRVIRGCPTSADNPFVFRFGVMTEVDD